MRTLELSVARSVGYFGQIEVTWQAVPREATMGDCSPSGGGVLVFEEGQVEAIIELEIVDDDLPENLEVSDLFIIGLFILGD